MKKIIIVFFVLSLAVVCFATDEVAVAFKLKNDIKLQRGEEINQAQQGDLLQSDDVLMSGDKSYAAVKFIDGSSIVKLFPNSVLKVTAAAEDGTLNKKSYLQSGRVFSKIKKKMGTFEIETATSVASVKGTEFLIEIGADGTTTVTTLSGEVVLYNKASETETSVPAGQQGTSSPDGSVGTEDFDENDLDPEVQEEIESVDVLQIEMQNSDGDTKTIRIEME